MKAVVKNMLNKKESLLVSVEYLTTYITSAHLRVIQQWLQNGRKESPQEWHVFYQRWPIKVLYLQLVLKSNSSED